LTELDAAECRRNTPLCVSKRSQWRKRYSDVIGQGKNSLAGCSNILLPPFLTITSLKRNFSLRFLTLKRRIENYNTSQIPSNSGLGLNHGLIIVQQKEKRQHQN